MKAKLSVGILERLGQGTLVVRIVVLSFFFFCV